MAKNQKRLIHDPNVGDNRCQVHHHAAITSYVLIWTSKYITRCQMSSKPLFSPSLNRRNPSIMVCIWAVNDCMMGASSWALYVNCICLFGTLPCHRNPQNSSGISDPVPTPSWAIGYSTPIKSLSGVRSLWNKGQTKLLLVLCITWEDPNSYC